MNLLLPSIGYASTFYRFKYFFSYLKKRHPQFVADVPHRINKNNSLPILIIIKDANHFPCELIDVEIFVDKKSIQISKINKKITTNYWDQVLKIDVSKYETGFHKIDIKISYKFKDKIFNCYNDNYRTTSHDAFPVYFSNSDLPVIDGFVGGDMHSHSNNTDDQIEFGASLSATLEMADALGLSYYAVTDHSYDLDDYPDNFLKNDPKLEKWHSFQKNVQTINEQDNNVMIIPGEEVSVRNSQNKTVHLLVYNDKKYFPGCGDSGEKWFRYFSELSIDDVLNNSSEQSLIFASHPADRVPSVHRFLLNRGHWSQQDASDERLCGVQIFNGHGTNKIDDAISFWKTLLLKGQKSFLLAGNDGHGNFGRNRYLSIPFVKINESYTQLFGKWRTDLFLGKTSKTVNNIIELLKNGNYSASNGPAVDFQIFDDKKTVINMGQESSLKPVAGKLTAKSSREFGGLTKIVIYQGQLNSGQEEVHLTKGLNKDIFELNFDFDIKENTSQFYMRAEVQSSGPKGEHFAFTNPIWFRPLK
ncbi:MAG: hypothetical protein D8M58_18095 [Calditrichaeota bacterium]|nr:MAG: hypothetical protein DWQ03_11325 [Calditrichota bacterium]MBL1207321.1 hypothetical protein [Calditrichota bacterium]NOG47153.1 PHP domain-containing protein [Calditrichota bacterium]